MHFCLLSGFGANAVNPYMAFESLDELLRQGQFAEDVDHIKVIDNYIAAIKKGILKTMSKMGISTLRSYYGAQLFECIGLNRSVVDVYFKGTSSRIGGIALKGIAAEAIARHNAAFAERSPGSLDLDFGGEYQYRFDGEGHLWNPVTVSKLQHAVMYEDQGAYDEYARAVNDQSKETCTLRGLFEFVDGQSVPLDEVESADEIVKRFCTGAMSHGSISKEAHECMAIKAEGVEFRTGVNVGQDISAHYLQKMFDCICLTMGAGQPRDLNVPGRNCDNVFFAMEYLALQNKLNSGEVKAATIDAKDKAVAVIGGGDTGSDCVGTARRQGAKEIYQFEILPKPPASRPDDTPWPMWPRIMRTSTSHEEGCDRRWSVTTKEIVVDESGVKELHCCQVEWEKQDGQWKMKETPKSEFVIKADIVLLAMGFVHAAHEGLVKALDLELDGRGNVKTNDFQTTQPWLFAAGDTVSGASLVVRAIDSGRMMAVAVDKWLKRE
jgi:hypothetical protein